MGIESKLISAFAKAHDSISTAKFAQMVYEEDGGPGSGNFGHKGRPGKVGGSGKGGGKAYRGGNAETGFFSTKADWKAGLSEQDKRNVDRIMKEYHSEKDLFRFDPYGDEHQMKKVMRERYTSIKAEARNWESDYVKRDLAEENLSKSELKVMRTIWDKIGLREDSIRDALGNQYPYYLALKNKALGGDNEIPEMPISVRYILSGESERKEREKRHFENELKKAQTSPETADAEAVAQVTKEKKSDLDKAQEEYMRKKEDVYKTPTVEFLLQKEGIKSLMLSTYTDLQVEMLREKAKKRSEEGKQARADLKEYDEFVRRRDELIAQGVPTMDDIEQKAHEFYLEYNKVKEDYDEYVRRSKDNPGYLDKIYVSSIRKQFEEKGVDKRPPAKYESQPSPIEIIKRLGGGDETDGSCYSLALAYAGCRAGYDVLDFRGGESQKIISRSKEDMRRIEGLQVEVINDYEPEYQKAIKALDKCESGKEYILVAGGHASVVRRLKGIEGRTEDKLQYLELQSATFNGWKDFGTHPTDILVERFGCEGSNTTREVTLTDIEALTSHPEYLKIVQYINTAERKQIKGGNGSEK